VLWELLAGAVAEGCPSPLQSFHVLAAGVVGLPLGPVTLLRGWTRPAGGCFPTQGESSPRSKVRFRLPLRPCTGFSSPGGGFGVGWVPGATCAQHAPRLVSRVAGGAAKPFPAAQTLLWVRVTTPVRAVV